MSQQENYEYSSESQDIQSVFGPFNDNRNALYEWMMKQTIVLPPSALVRKATNQWVEHHVATSFAECSLHAANMTENKDLAQKVIMDSFETDDIERRSLFGLVMPDLELGALDSDQLHPKIQKLIAASHLRRTASKFEALYIEAIKQDTDPFIDRLQARRMQRSKYYLMSPEIAEHEVVGLLDPHTDYLELVAQTYGSWILHRYIKPEAFNHE